MMTKSNIRWVGFCLSLGTFVLTLQSFVGCSAGPAKNPGTECTSDGDCSGNATCDNGVCVDESSSGSSSSGGGSSGSSSSGGMAAPPTCRQTCTTVNDCATAVPLLDADNWDCKDGVCENLGCNSAQECIDTYGNPNYDCATTSGSTIKSCVQTCSVPADCTGGSIVPVLDADNWACNAGRCAYTGCNTTQECVDTYMGDYACEAISGATLKTCRQKCTAVADCVSGTGALSDADNWECNATYCEYLGCNSTQECTDTFMKNNYICK